MSKNNEKKRTAEIPCVTCGAILKPKYGYVEDKSEGQNKPKLQIISWICPNKCGKWVPFEETIEDIWNDEQRYKKSMSSFKGGSENNKGRKDNKQKLKRSPYELL